MAEAKEVQYKEPKRLTEGESYMVELVVVGKAVRVPAQKVYSLESLIGSCAIVVATQFPNVSGFSILTADGETLLHEAVYALPLLLHAAPIIQAVTGQQPLRTAVPVISSAKPEEVAKMFADAKERHKLIQ
jgi:hypothetical protein